MTVISSKEFATNQNKYFDMAMNERIFVQRGDNMFHRKHTNDNDTTVKKRVYYEPDEDFYKSITIDEFKKRAIKVVEKAYKRYINERNNITEGTRIS